MFQDVTTIGFDHRSIRRLASNSDLAKHELGIDEQEEPAFWDTATQPRHFCQTDAECTPDMTCIQTKCLPYLSIGESGCVSSLQCSRTTLGSTCHHDQTLDVSSCACQSSWYWHHRQCVRDCPVGTEADQNVCVEYSKEGHKSSVLTDFTQRIANLFTSPLHKDKTNR